MDITPSTNSGLEVITPSERDLKHDLTRTEIESGLQRLSICLQRQQLPFLILIEDDENEMVLFKNALRRANVAVEFMHFKDGEQALEYFRGKGGFADREMYPLPNLTVLDFNLTRSSGLHILQEIRSSPHLKQLVVVGLTASENSQELAQARDLKINDCIKKPQNLLGLVAVVQDLKLVWLDRAI